MRWSFGRGGSSWDAEAEAVTFGGDFDGTAAAHIGEVFSGGGGYYSETDDPASGVVTGPPLRDCMRATNTGDVLFIYPS
jgi:hypothetical protein